MIEGFTESRIRGDGVDIAVSTGGEGPPLLLLHGYPQTRLIWRKMAARLARSFTLVMPDLRGYGASDKPEGDAEHHTYSKRAMATDMVAVMAALGHSRFRLAGHDRGGRVAYRLALDHAAAVERIAVLDIVPTLEQFDAVTRTSALGSYHWYFLAQPHPFPETMIGRDPAYFVRHTIESWCATEGAIEPEAMDAYVAAFSDPASIHATCEDYRAGATVDCEIDSEDREAGHVIEAPLMALWGDRGRPHKRSSVVETWKKWSRLVEGDGIDSGHFLPEEAPDETAAKLEGFFLR